MDPSKPEPQPRNGRDAATAAARTTNRIGREAEFCCGPGIPYEEDCLGNGRIPVDQRGEATRCPKCKVERRKRHMRRRSNQEPETPRQRTRGSDRPTTFSEALEEADQVLAERAAQNRQRHPEIHWRTTHDETNEGSSVEFDSIDLRGSINKS